MVSFSVIIVTHGREELLMKCLDSLRPGTTPWELVLMCNGEVLSQKVLDFLPGLTPHTKILHSEQKLNPGAARNTAVREASGEWLFFIDDDAYVLNNYWEIVLPLLFEHSYDVIGGPDAIPPGMSGFSTSLALALSSPFCTGTTFNRHKPTGTKIRPADEEILTSCNLWIRRALFTEDEFPENFIRAEETVLLQKLKKKSKGLFYHPKIRVGHFRRSHLKDLWRPSFYAGFSRSKLMAQKIAKGNEAFWLPSIFVLLHFTFFLDPHSFWYLARMYASIILFVSITLAMKVRRVYLFPLIAFIHYFIVFMFGIGFLSERFQRLKKSDT